MPRIPDQLLESVVYLFQDKTSAKKGIGAGGTGFLVDYPGESGARHTYVVSNIHVVRNGCCTLRINKRGRGVDTLTIPSSSWVDHPSSDDVSIAPIRHALDTWAVTALTWEDFCPTAERFEELNIGIGDDVVMLGRFLGHSGRKQNAPLARFGSIAMMDSEPVKDGREMLVNAYLVEMRSLPGCSGSPVFIVIGAGSYRGTYGGEEAPKMMPFFTETIGLLGIDTGHKPLLNPVLDPNGELKSPRQVVQQNSGVAIVAPFYAIRETFESDELAIQRSK